MISVRSQLLEGAVLHAAFRDFWDFGLVEGTLSCESRSDPSRWILLVACTDSGKLLLYYRQWDALRWAAVKRLRCHETRSSEPPHGEFKLIARPFKICQNNSSRTLTPRPTASIHKPTASRQKTNCTIHLHGTHLLGNGLIN